ncbi:MAG: hypothetical protein K2P95_02200, partial [Hyphomonadaceae bacterium]|nr:hypothetical protein [Hyphomonadaceae bacterium]
GIRRSISVRPDGKGASPPAAIAAEDVPGKPAKPPGVESAIPGLPPKELASLHANAMRLLQSGAAKMRTEAERLLPLIEAELERRKAAAPPERVRKAVAPRKPAAPRKTPAKRKPAKGA